MSKMNELSISNLEDGYAEHVEEQRQELRKEGAEEFRQDILRELESLKIKSWTSQQKIAYEAAIIVVERANI
jgi:uncharacterized protein YnzC (UPF0291/DUF896 family)